MLLIILNLLLFMPLFFSCSDTESGHESSDSGVRLLTHNVWYGFTRVPERKTRWLDWMREQKPDIVFLQELNEYTPEKLKQDAAYWGHDFSVLLKEDGFPTGVTSRYAIADIQRYTDGFHHGLLRTKIEDIYFYTIHLHPSNWEVRIREIDLILSDIQALPEGARVILAGDFNTFSPHDSIYYAHKQLEPFFAQRDLQYGERNLNNGKLDYTALTRLMQDGFTDLEFHMRDEGYEFTGTFPTKIAKSGDHGSQRRLDYIFANAELFPYMRRASIVVDDTTWILSDHLPVVVDLAID